MGLPAPFNLANSLQLGTGIWSLGASRSILLPNGSSEVVRTGLVDIGEIDTGDISIDPGTSTDYRSKRERSRPIRKTAPGEGTVSVSWTTNSLTFDNLGLFTGGDTITKSQAATPVVDELVLGIGSNRNYQLGETETNSIGNRGFTGALTLAAGPAAVTPWAAAATVAKNDIYEPVAAGGALFVAINSGVTSGTEPTWPTTVGDTITELNATGSDGIVWMMITGDKTQTFTQDVDYVVDDTTGTGGQFQWLNSTSDVFAVFASYTPVATSWRQIEGGKRLSYDGYAEFRGDADNSEVVIKIPAMTVTSSGTLSTLSEADTFISMGFEGTMRQVQGQPLFTWNGVPF